MTTHVSYSQMNSITRCSWQYALERIARVPQTPAWYLVGGKAFHNAVEHMLRYGTHLEAHSVWDKAWADALAKQIEDTDIHPDLWRAAGRATKDKPNGEDGTWWYVAGEQMLRDWLVWYENSPDFRVALFNIDSVQPTFGVEMDLSGTLAGTEFKAYVDTVFVTGDHHLVVDWKTGSRKPSSAEQLGVYACLLEQRGLPRPAYGAYYMARKGEFTIPEPLDRYTEDYFNRLYAPRVEIKARGLFTPNVGDFCGSCGVRDYCFAVGGSLAHTVEGIAG